MVKNNYICNLKKIVLEFTSSELKLYFVENAYVT